MHELAWNFLRHSFTRCNGGFQVISRNILKNCSVGRGSINNNLVVHTLLRGLKSSRLKKNLLTCVFFFCKHIFYRQCPNQTANKHL